MKKAILLLTAPFLLIDACSSARLVKKDTDNDKPSVSIDLIYKTHESVSQSSCDARKEIVIRELSNGEFDLHTRFDPPIKDHYRKQVLQTASSIEQ